MSLPEPHEGVTGMDYTQDSLLDIDETGLTWRQDGMERFYRLWQSSLNAERWGDIGTRMDSPAVGDIVMEVTSFFLLSKESYRRQAFGILRDVRTEWECTAGEWTAAMGEETAAAEAEGRDFRPHERRTVKSWYVQYGPSAEDICRWGNCKFIALPPKLRHVLDGD
jgi:hypothetical protein